MIINFDAKPLTDVIAAPLKAIGLAPEIKQPDSGPSASEIAAAERKAEEEEQRKQRALAFERQGRRSTLLTGGQGAGPVGSANVRRSVLGAG